MYLAIKHYIKFLMLVNNLYDAMLFYQKGLPKISRL